MLSIDLNRVIINTVISLLHLNLLFFSFTLINIPNHKVCDGFTTRSHSKFCTVLIFRLNKLCIGALGYFVGGEPEALLWSGRKPFTFCQVRLIRSPLYTVVSVQLRWTGRNSCCNVFLSSVVSPNHSTFCATNARGSSKTEEPALFSSLVCEIHPLRHLH